MKKTHSFSEKCYEILKKVPKGRVTTYKEIAKALNTKAFRAVGRAMHNNPLAPEVPCHRVICADGRIGGYAKGIKKKVKLLMKEGVEVKDNKILGFKIRLHKFPS